MRKFVVAITAALIVSGTAWAADVAVDGGDNYAVPNLAAPFPNDQSTLELMWDNGTRRWSVVWLGEVGPSIWVANDFDASTL